VIVHAHMVPGVTMLSLLESLNKTMNYKLAKQLKDAGFPQEGINKDRGFNIETGEPIMFPTLSELIDACGDISFELNKEDTGKKWTACGEYPDSEEGKTPEIAVAKLWLKLNQNNDKRKTKKEI